MKQVLDLAKRLIAIPSTSDNPTALKEILKIAKEELTGFNFKKFEKNKNFSLLFYNTKSLPKKFKLILNGHLDVVSVKDDQYKPKETNGKLYGRGAYDMKTATAAMILIFKELAGKVHYPLGLQLVTDEEVGGFNGTKYQIGKGIKADFVIAGENTDLKINHQSKGVIWLKITSGGTGAHGAYPWLGKNAIWQMHKLLTKLEKKYPLPLIEEWCTTVNLATIESPNKTYNKVPDQCIAYLDIRYIPEDTDKIVENIQNLVGSDGQVELILKEPAHLTGENNSYVKKLSEAIKKVSGKNSELVSKHGSSDIRHFNKVGIEGITFGPTGAGHHSDNEWVSIKSLEQYYKILKNFLLSI